MTTETGYSLQEVRDLAHAAMMGLARRNVPIPARLVAQIREADVLLAEQNEEGVDLP